MTARSRTMLLVTRLSAGALVLGSMLSSAYAGEQCVAVGEVHSAVARHGVDMTALLRQTVESEVAKIDPAKTVGKRHAVLSVSLLEMGEHGALDTCTVVATVRDAAKGALLATLQGDAKMTHDATHALSTDAAMVRSAVQGFVVRLPEALK